MSLKWQVLHPSSLTASDLAAWDGLCAAQPAFGNPFLAPAFARAVGTVRQDVRVAVARRGDGAGEPVAFWAHHRRPGGLLRPLAAPISDWHGPVTAPGVRLDPAAMVAACGGGAARFSGLVDPAGAFAKVALAKNESWQIDLSAGAKAYRARLQDTQKKNLANTQRCARKAEREIGPISYTFQSLCDRSWDAVIAWKRAQFAETRRHDIFTAPWIRAVFARLRTQRDPAFGVVFSTVRIGDRLAAGEIYLRHGARLHAWISAFDKTLGAYAPGHILTDRLLDGAEEQGVQIIDFGAGSDDYKARWCLDHAPVFEAVVHAQSPVGRARAAAFSGWRAASAGLGSANVVLQKARRRADHVFAAESSWIGASLALAYSAFARRHGLP